MINNPNVVLNFVKELYALPSQNDNDTLVEDEHGTVIRLNNGQFQYRVQRKVNGINSLKDTLDRLNLEVVPIEKAKTVLVNKQTNTVAYVALQVRDKGLNDRYEGLTPDERIKVDTHVANGIGFNLAKAIVKREDLNAARDLDNQAAKEELEAADEDEEQNKNRQKRLISQQFIQAQLDEVFEPAFEINNGVRLSFEGALKNFNETKALTADQEKTLFPFIKHTYESVDEYLNNSNIQLPAGTSPYFNTVHEILKGLNREELKKIYYKDLKLDTEGGKKGLIDNFKENEDKILQNEKLALIRQVEKVGIDVSKLNEKTYTDGLQDHAKTLYDKIKDVKNLQNLLKEFQSSTVTKDNVKAYGKLQLTKQVLGEICKAANGEQIEDLDKKFNILDGQDQTYGDRLRSAFQNHNEIFNKIQLELLQTQGLEVATKIGGLDFSEVDAASYPIPDATNLVTNHTESLLDRNRQYNLNFLEDGQVIKMSHHFAEKVSTTLNNPYVVNAGAAAKVELQKGQQEKYLEAAMIKVKRGEAAQLFVSTNEHWTTCSLLPLQNNKFVIIGMDSMGKCETIANDIVPKLVDFGKKLGLGVEKDGEKNVFNMSVNGQQQGACCGFASACNGFSLQKTYNDLTKNGSQLVKDGNFDKDAFKAVLLSNIVYRQDTIKQNDGSDFSGSVLYGNKKSDLSLTNFVKQFGGLALQNIASKEAMIKHLGENKVEIKQDNLSYFVDKTKLATLVGQITNRARTSDSQMTITYSGKNYHLSQDVLNQIKNVNFVKGLGKVLNGEPLDIMLSNNRTKGIFIKILRDKFADDKNPYTKQFVEDRESLKNIIHIDQEIEAKIKAVIQSALPNNAKENLQPVVEISTWDAILLWLYNTPLLGRLVELCGAEVVNCASMVDNLESTCNSWQQYKALSELSNTLLHQSNNEILAN